MYFVQKAIIRFLDVQAGVMFYSRQPPFVSFLHVGISVLFQVTHLALWGTDLLLVRQAPEDDKVHLQLKDMGMG